MDQIHFQEIQEIQEEEERRGEGEVVREAVDLVS